MDMVVGAIGRPEFLDGRADVMCSQNVRRFWGKLGYHDTFPTRMERHRSVSGKDKIKLGHGDADPLYDEGHDIRQHVYEGTELIEFVSCFGGLALYNPIAFQLCEYDESGSDSEHVLFH